MPVDHRLSPCRAVSRAVSRAVNHAVSCAARRFEASGRSESFDSLDT